MLKRAAGRLGDAPAALVQADLLDLPFLPSRFATVACFGTLHVLDDPWAALAALRDQAAPGGRFFTSMLVSDRAVGRVYLAALHRQGEAGPPQRVAELAAAARAIFGTVSLRSIHRVDGVAAGGHGSVLIGTDAPPVPQQDPSVGPRASLRNRRGVVDTDQFRVDAQA